MLHLHEGGEALYPVRASREVATAHARAGSTVQLDYRRRLVADKGEPWCRSKDVTERKLKLGDVVQAAKT